MSWMLHRPAELTPTGTAQKCPGLPVRMCVYEIVSVREYKY